MRIRLFVALLGCGIFAGSTDAQYYSNVLQNPGFESGASETEITSWNRFGNAYRYSSAAAHGGSYALDAWGNYWPTNPPDWNASGVYQEHSANQGEIWEASVWFNVAAPILGASYGAINIEFYNEAAQKIYGGSSAEKITSVSPTGQWIQVKVRAQATLDTAWVRVIPLYLQSPPYTNGAVWFDDCALYLIPTSQIRFAGRDWRVLDQPSSPGENYYSTNCVWVDTNGWLHMGLKQINGVWHCPFLEGTESLGFGEYRWYVGTPLEHLDSNLVVGLFTYAQEPVFGTNQNEVDIEVSHSFPGTQTNCLVYTVQPYTIPGYSYSHPLEVTNELTTHRFIWRPDRVDWQSYYGHTPEPEDTNHYIAAWRFEGRGIPIETNEHPYMNLWLFYTNAPIDTEHVEMVIYDFAFNPFNGFILRDDFEDGEIGNEWVVMDSGDDTATVEEKDGRLILSSGIIWQPVGIATKDPIHRNERGTKYVFSALIDSAGMPEVKTYVVFSTERTNSVDSLPTAGYLYGYFNTWEDRVTMVFCTKTNGSGGVRYEASLTNVSGYFNAGGIEMGFELDDRYYKVLLRDANGRDLPVTLLSGAAEGEHQFGESLSNGYFYVASYNSDVTPSIVSSAWSRVTVGITGQGDRTILDTPRWEGSNFVFSFDNYCDTAAEVWRTTNLASPFELVTTCAVSLVDRQAFTDNVSEIGSAFYQIRMPK